MKTKEKVQAAIEERIKSRPGLDLKNIDIAITDVTFEKNLAHATVSFHPKGDANLSSGMSMKYTLEAREGKWVVTKTGMSGDHAGTMNPAQGDGAAGALPAGHPSVNPGASPANPHIPAPTQ
jgi:hypothetical protein